MMRCFVSCLVICLYFVYPLEGYLQPQGVPDDIWQEVQPYLLPEAHPAKKQLDKLFSKARHTHDLLTLYLGGFEYKYRTNPQKIIVAKHPKLKGIVLKLYTDTQSGFPDWPMWIHRIQGAKLVQEAIHQLDAEQFFKAPQKWIYPLPDWPAADAATEIKHFILVVENMHVKAALTNERMWQSPFTMTKERMRALYLIIQQLGLFDSVFIDNVPFCSDGRQAFIDIEHFYWWPVRFDRLLGRFPKELQPYWKELMLNGP